MNENEYLARMISEQLETGSPLVLASIIGSKGSSPRHTGTKMMMAANGKSYGTIGGGILEATTLKESRVAFSNQTSRFMSFEMLGDNALAPAPICGGQTTLLLDYVLPSEENIEFFQSLQEAVLKDEDFHFLTVLESSGDIAVVVGHSLINRDGEVSGTFDWPEQNINLVKAEMQNSSSIMVLPMDNITIVIDPVCRVKTIYCFGSGHVALPTTHIAALAGFRVIVADDRAEYASAERFPDAGRIILLKDFSKALEGLPIDSDSFIVILTRGHQTDRIVLEQALKTDASYIGMMGSKRKRDTIYATLLSQGILKEQLDSIHCPIGLAIKAETPEEIAVSIVAELIAERARQRDERKA
jgi:xanthine dehydrogenase accessory factor